MNIKRTRLTLLAIVVLALLVGLVVWPKGPNLNLKPLGINYQKELKIHEGLDLQGGSHLVYQADMSKVPEKDRTERLSSAVTIIGRRVNSLGVSEPLVQSSSVAGDYRVIVELPGVTDVAEASSVIGRTVKLEFWESRAANDPPEEPQAILAVQQLSEYKRTNLTGDDLKLAGVSFEQTGEPKVDLTFNSDGTRKFDEISRRNIGRIVPITVDAGEVGGGIISPARIQEEIPSGQAQITGGFDLQSAKTLAIQLNAGRLPVPVKLVEQRTVGPTLGQDSVEKSLAAGSVGLLLVALFMILYYRLPGVLAVGALLLYTGLMVAIFKLLSVTLTLAGIAGFILSIGIAVDANILIFERMKEELRGGRDLGPAIEVGFARAFTSIRDSNAASLLMSGVLYAFGSGTIRGFAVVLALGVAVSLFSAITVTRTLMRLVGRTRLGDHLGWWGLRKSERSKEANHAA